MGNWKRKLIYFLAGVFFLFFFTITAPENHTETEDVYHYALLVEKGAFAEQIEVNRLLALPMLGSAFKIAKTLGYNGRAFPFLIYINRFLAVLILYLFYCVLKGMKLSSVEKGRESPPFWRSLSIIDSRLAPVLCLAFSYGFWRYANAAEVYPLVMVFLLASWHFTLTDRWLAAAVLSAWGILVHLLNIIPLLLIIPFYYLLRSEWKKTVLHTVLTGGIVFLGYAICRHFLEWSAIGVSTHSDSETGLSVENIARAGAAFGQCVVSGNFLFGFEWFQLMLVKLFPWRMLNEEVFMGVHMPTWIPWVGLITLGTVFTALVVSLHFRCIGVSMRPFWYSALVWLILYTAALMRVESGSPELWIMALVPALFVLVPLLRCSRSFWLAGALLLHNFFAGLLPVLPQSTDYYAAKSEWILDQTNEKDIVLTSYEPILIFYLNYYAKADVLNSGTLSLDALSKQLEQAEGSVYALANFFEPLHSMRVNMPRLFDRMQKTGAVYRPKFRKIHDDVFGGIFVWIRAERER